MKPARRFPPADWMDAPDTRAVFDALAGGGATLRFVGGCVRDAVLGRPVADIDLATDAVPERVLELLGASRIRAVPTGLAHGTVTAIPERRPFQITTLRRDVETDGRRATVAFGTDWEEDARRRDFTMNALFANPDGTVVDFVGGLDDLEAGRVRFIGKAADRIAEDYLRVLRYFRFQAYYGRTEPDPKAIAACRAGAAGTVRLSGERVWQELSKILLAPDPVPVVRLMADNNVLHHVLRLPWRVGGLSAMVMLEAAVGRPPDAIRRLAALVDPGVRQASALATRLRLPREDTGRLTEMIVERGNTAADMPERAQRRALYNLGADVFGDMVLVDWADRIRDDSGAATAETERWKTLWQAIAAFERPEFPLVGADVMERGIEEGPEVGQILKAVETWWIDDAFRADRDACLERLRYVIGRRPKSKD